VVLDDAKGLFYGWRRDWWVMSECDIESRYSRDVRRALRIARKDSFVADRFELGVNFIKQANCFSPRRPLSSDPGFTVGQVQSLRQVPKSKLKPRFSNQKRKREKKKKTQHSQRFQSFHNNRPSRGPISLQIHEKIQRLSTTRIKDAIVRLLSQKARIARILSLQNTQNWINVKRFKSSGRSERPLLVTNMKGPVVEPDVCFS
jgi:hypothetical protein